MSTLVRRTPRRRVLTGSRPLLLTTKVRIRTHLSTLSVNLEVGREREQTCRGWRTARAATPGAIREARGGRHSLPPRRHSRPEGVAVTLPLHRGATTHCSNCSV